jgi:cytoskeletal protein CcmA (bactofilin family)
MFRRSDMGSKNGSNMDNIVGLLGKGTEFEGKLIFEGTLRIDGKFRGEVITSGILAVGDGAVVHAEIQAETIIVRGEVHGNLKAAKQVEIKGNGKLFGNINTPSLIVDEGVIFEGSCQMSAPEKTVIPLDVKK